MVSSILFLPIAKRYRAGFYQIGIFLYDEGVIINDIKVGLLAYGAIGHEHNLAVQTTPCLVLAAVCDINPQRITAALELAPQAVPFADAFLMLDSGLVELVVISTPPNSHYQWAKEALKRGIHVVLEKPMALTTDECDELMDLAAAQKLLLVVYQNRRFDADFITMRKLITSGAIGDVFQFDSFVGGYAEPCSYWHSDVAVSGGAIFDWGSHFLDQVLAIMKDTVAHVSGQNHKRHWTNCTNADHAQVTITFVNGKQATFINSDLAAARKPKFYVLGTTGAIVGDWNPTAEPAVADLPAILTLHREDRTSELVELDCVPPNAFHRSIVDYLTKGVAMEVNAKQSRDVVAIMQAAEQSALQNGIPITPSLLLR
ncbi:MAG: Gfo/Idh/MocA family oxidoreductase [Ilumatobacteraceae bacterium]|nr:Gfo/Idh/MocA family oxidoreductase [Ilumatobacteraceae bacterium]